MELEGRVYTDEWSIPYRAEESFAQCLIASTKLIEHGAGMYISFYIDLGKQIKFFSLDLWNSDENCKKFLERCMPECFNKLLMSNAVQR